MNILIVDDHATNLRLLRAQLEGEGHVVADAADGEEALKVLANLAVDAVISDALMPNMDGFRLCLEIRRDKRFAGLPFIIYTSTYDSPADRKLALDAGADGYVVKPAPIPVLVEALRAACRTAENRTERTPMAPEEMGVIKQYNAALVAKLEDKNVDLEAAIGELRASEERFRQLAENIDEVFWMTDPAKHTMLYISPAYEAIWGRTCASLYANPLNWVEAIHPEDRARVLAAAQSRQATGDYDETYRIVRPGGEVRWIRDRAFPVRNEAGEVYRMVGTAQDITERRRLEEARRLSEERFTAIFRHSPVAIGYAGIDGRLHDLNGQFCAFFGHAREAMIGRTAHELGLWAEPAERSRLVAQLQEGKPVRNHEAQFRRRDGELRTGLISAEMLRVGDEPMLLTMIVDISDRKRAEEAIQALNAELEHRVVERTAQLKVANKELEAFSYSISHDLRAPLRAMDGYARAVLEEFGPALPAGGRDYIETIRGETRRMAHLIDDLLEFSRLGRQALHRQPVMIDELVRGALEELRREHPGRQVGLQLGALPPCQGDPALLKQVWRNLLSNAFKYTLKCPQPAIEVGCLTPETTPTYFVRDNGAGFDMRYAGKLFGVFQRLHRPEDYPGTGVGLAIVQQIVQRHGGRIWAEAAVGKGATFFFTLEGERGGEGLP